MSLTMQVAGSLGIAVLASVLGHRATFHLAVVGQGLDATRPAFVGAAHAVAARALELGSSPSDAALLGRAVVARKIAGGAQVLAFDDAFLVGAVIVLASVIPALFLDSRPELPRTRPAEQAKLFIAD